MKKLFALLLVVAMMLSLTAVVASAEDHEPVTIEFSCWGSAEATTSEAFHAMLDGFMAKYPWITIELTESNFDGVNTSMLTRLAANDAPDVMQANNRWIAAYIEMDGLLPLEEYLSEETMADFTPGMMKATNVDGHQYSVPWVPFTNALFCNMDLLAQAGYDHAPTTRDEMIEMAYAVAALGTNAEGNKVYGRTLASQVLNGAGMEFLTEIWAKGGDFYAPDGSIAYGDDATVAALAEAQKEFADGVIASGNQIADNRTLFSNGQVAFHFDGSAQINNFSDVNFKVVLLPGADEKTPGAIYSSEHHLVAAKNTEHPEEVALFIDYLTGPEAFEIYTKTCDVFPARASASEISYYQNLSDDMKVFLASAEYVKPLPTDRSDCVAVLELVASATERVCVGMEDPAAVAADVHDQLVALR